MEPSPEFRIELAVAADLHQLAEINRAAYVEETITRIAYPAWPDEANMLKMFLVRIEDRLSHKDTQVFKAVEPLSERAVGFACWTLERGSHGADTNEKEPSNPTTKALQLNTAGLNLEFLAAMGADAEALTSHRKGTEHYYLSAFAVAPEFQRRGIGTRLLRHCLDIADRARLPAWLTSLPGSYGLYLRLGFRDIDHRDADLNA